MTDKPAHIHAVARPGEGVEDRVPREKRIRGSGIARVWNAFSDAPGRFHAGQWRSEDEVRRVDYTETELCVILEGRVRLADDVSSADVCSGSCGIDNVRTTVSATDF